MSSIGKWAFLLGLLLALVAAHVDIWWLPWLVGGLGVLVGLLNVAAEEVSTFLWGATGLALALWIIQHQHYNPEWLTHIVFFINVFVTHVLLVVGLLTLFKTARN